MVLCGPGAGRANGANDVPKAVATLAGPASTKLRTAIIWGTVTTASAVSWSR